MIDYFLLYIVGVLLVGFVKALNFDNSLLTAARIAVFWPLYAIRWLITSFILAIKGE